MPYLSLLSTARIARRLAGVFVLLASGAVFAQQAPDAGSLLREQLDTAPTLPERNTPAIQSDEGTTPTAPVADSVQFVVTSIRISGVSVFSEAQLLEQVRNIIGQMVGFAELDAAAARISHYYRSHGYPVARAYL